jgi:hypothetical protein
MVVNGPVGIAGTYDANAASFGAALTLGGITGDVVLIEDDTVPTSDGCETIVNGAALAGKIALIDRGLCTFVIKAAAAQANGAIAVIVANNAGGPLAPGGSDPAITIPVVGISQADGQLLKDNLASGVNVTLNLDPTRLAGGDDAGRPLMFTPNPFQGGSSVSHWDVTLSPNALMEPAINSDLSSSVDLTRYAFEDIGWLPRVTDVEPGPAPGRLAFVGTPRPNPSADGSSVSFRIPKPEYVRLAVVDIRGGKVRTVQEGMMPAGDHTTRWDGRTDGNRQVAPGVYLFSLTTSEGTITQRVSVIR